MKEFFIRASEMPASAEAVYAFHAAPGALQKLLPPWEPVRIIARSGGIEDIGARVILSVSVGPFSRKWVSEHVECEPGQMFVDRMVSGPLAYWEHMHVFIPDGPNASTLEDRITYELPFGAIGHFFFGAYARRRLEKLFEWRHRVTAEWVAGQGASSSAAGPGLSSSASSAR
ncbi:MAG TPA: SRPBCC family protein [Methylomirabilota bacterium]|nr:SRPBCC family protein [Methylomirabilota bacterium]